MDLMEISSFNILLLGAGACVLVLATIAVRHSSETMFSSGHPIREAVSVVPLIMLFSGSMLFLQGETLLFGFVLTIVVTIVSYWHTEQNTTTRWPVTAVGYLALACLFVAVTRLHYFSSDWSFIRAMMDTFQPYTF